MKNKAIRHRVFCLDGQTPSLNSQGHRDGAPGAAPGAAGAIPSWEPDPLLLPPHTGPWPRDAKRAGKS